MREYVHNLLRDVLPAAAPRAWQLRWHLRGGLPVSDLDDIKPGIRFCPNDFTEEARSKLEPLPDFWTDEGEKPTVTGNYNEALGKSMAGLQQPIPGTTEGKWRD